MSLRARMLVLFLVLAVVPIVALGVLTQVRSVAAVESMIAAQNSRIADRVAATIEQRASLVQSDLLLPWENAEAAAWRTSGRGDASPS